MTYHRVFDTKLIAVQKTRCPANITLSDVTPWSRPGLRRTPTDNGTPVAHPHHLRSFLRLVREGRSCAGPSYFLGERSPKGITDHESCQHHGFALPILSMKFGRRCLPHSQAAGTSRPWPAPHPGKGQTLQYLVADRGVRLRPSPQTF